MAQSFSRIPSRSFSWFFIAAFSLALICGLLEALETLVLSTKLGMLGWKTGNSVQVLIAAPAVYALIYPDRSRAVRGYFRALERNGVGCGDGLGAAGPVWVFRHHAARSLVLAVCLPHARPWARNRAHPRVSGRPGGVGTPFDPVGHATGDCGSIVAIGGIAIARHREQTAVKSLPAAPAGAPNVLLLVMDTQRADHLTPTDIPEPQHRVWRSLAAEGTIFTWASSSAVTTLPSHSSMMTGRLVQEHGAGSGGRLFLDRRFPTLAEQLRAKGYLTGGFVANTYWTGRHTGLNRGFIHYEDFYSSPMDALARTVLGRHLAYDLFPRFGQIDIPGRKRASQVKEELLHWVDANPGHPFFRIPELLRRSRALSAGQGLRRPLLLGAKLGRAAS